MLSIDPIDTYAYRMRKGVICKREKIRTNNIKNNTKMFNFVYTKCLYFKRRHKRT